MEEEYLSTASRQSVVHRSGRSGWVLLGVLLVVAGGFAAWRFGSAAETSAAADSEIGAGTLGAESATDRARDSIPGPQKEASPYLYGSAQPVLGREVGLVVFASSTNGLVRLDLDTGELVLVGDPSAPLLRTEEHLVLSSQERGEVYSADLTDLNEVSSIGIGGFSVVPSSKEGRVWGFQLGSFGDAITSAVEIDVATGDREQTVTGPGGLFGEILNPEVLTPPAGGVYALRTGEYERVADGSVVAQNSDMLLVERCDSELDCSVHWLDATTFEPRLELKQPVVEGLARGRMLGGTPWLLLQDARFQSSRLFHATTGEVVPNVGASEASTMSADGEVFAAFGNANVLELRDLTTGQWKVVLDIRGRRFRNGIVLVPKALLVP